MSLNIAHARRKAQHQSLLKDSTIRRNLELIAGVLEREQPHVVALQEADGPSFWSGGFDHVEALAGLAGFPHAFRGEHNREVLSRLDLSYGTALLSHLPLEATHSHAFLQNWRDTKGFVAATVAPEALAGEPVDVVSIHLDFLADRVRRRQVEQLIERFRGHDGHLVVMGDFNCAWSERRRSLDLLLHELKLRPCRESGGRDLSRLATARPAGLDSGLGGTGVFDLRHTRRPGLGPPGGGGGGSPPEDRPCTRGSGCRFRPGACPACRSRRARARNRPERAAR